MAISKIPTGFTHSEVIIIDDDQNFLDMLQTMLRESVTTFNSPIKALDYINHEKNINDLSALEIDNEKSPEEILNSFVQWFEGNNTQYLSVLVVDYSMPQMSGLEMLSKLKKTNLKTILLTGEADEKIAVKAFNEGLIHHFIAKSDPEVSKSLKKAIFDLRLRFFRDLFLPIACKICDNSVASCLKTTDYDNAVLKFIEENNITNFYLLNQEGTFAATDNEEHAILSLANKSKLDYYLKIIADNEMSDELSEVVSMLTCQSHILSFNSPSSDHDPLDTWIDKLVPVTQKLGGTYLSKTGRYET